MAMTQIGKQTFWHVDCVLTGKRYTIAPISITIKKNEMAKSTQMHYFWQFMVAMNETRIPNYLFMNIIIFKLAPYMKIKRWLGLNLLLAIAEMTLNHKIAYDLFWIHGHCQTWTWSRNRWRRWQESQTSMRRRNKCNEPWADMTLCPQHPCEFQTFNDIHPEKHPFWNTHTIRQTKRNNVSVSKSP